jgi:hypothetical protein
VSLTDPDQVEFVVRIARKTWRTMRSETVPELVSEVWTALTRVIGKYEKARGRFAPGPDQVMFPVGSSFLGWTNSYIQPCTAALRDQEQLPCLPIDPAELALTGGGGVDPADHSNLDPRQQFFFPELVIDRSALSPDALARRYRREEFALELLQTVQQAWLSWQRSQTSACPLTPREATRSALRLTFPHLPENALSQRMARDVGNIAFGVAHLLAQALPSAPLGVRALDTVELDTAMEVAHLGWRSLELEGVMALLIEALFDDEIPEDRVAARIFWVDETVGWMEEIGPRATVHLRPVVETLTVRLSEKPIEHANIRAEAPIAHAIINAHERMTRWLEDEDEE